MSGAPARRRRRTAAMALVLASGAAAPGPAAATEFEVVTRPPEPLPASYRGAGITAADLGLAPVRAALLARPPLGPAVWRAAAGGPRPRRMLVAFLADARPPPGLAARLTDLGYPAWGTLVAGGPTARWAQAGETGLFLIRLDRLVAERAAGGGATVGGLIAHELTHVAQRSWGALGPAKGGRREAHDQVDEAEALLVETLVDQAWIRRRRAAGIPPTGREVRRLGVPIDAAGLVTCARKVAGTPAYRALPAAPRYAPGYDPAADPFAALRAGPPPGRGRGRRRGRRRR